MRAWWVMIALVLGGCEQAPSAVPSDQGVSTSDFDELKQKVERLEGRLEAADPSAVLKLSNKGFSVIPTDVGRLTLEMKKTEAVGAGTKVTLTIGNPTSAKITEMELFGWWSKVSPAGEIQEPVTFPSPLKIDEDCRPGSWCKGTVILDGVKPADLGALGITSIAISSMTLLQ